MPAMRLPLNKDQFLLRPDIAFLNHGSFGACPRPVFETYQSWQRQLEEQPVEFLGRRFNDLLAEARASLAAYLGTQPTSLVYVPNATYGMGRYAFGHPGAGGSTGFADPERELAFGFVTNTLGPYVLMDPRAQKLARVVKDCLG